MVGAVRLDAKADAAGAIQGRNWQALRLLLPEKRLALLEDVAATGEAKLARSGEPTLVADGPSGKLHLHSAYNPRAEAARWADELDSQGWEVAVIFGFGLGYHLEELLDRNPGGRIIVVEPLPSVFKYALAVRDLTHLLERRLDLVLASDATEAAAELFKLLYSSLHARQALFAWPPYLRLAPGYWESVQHGVGDLVRQALVNLATNRAWSLAWLDNFFANLIESAEDPAVSCLLPHFAGRPAIIVAAGPSLDKNVRLLGEVRGRALVVAAGSAINPLRKHGIRPDLLVSFDPGEANYAHFIGLDSAGLPLVYSPTIFWRIVAEYKGPRFAMGMDVFPFVEDLFGRLGEPRGSVASGPSVANVAWDLVRQMGCDPVIFVGQDLAFTDARTHADGAVHGRALRPEELEAQGIIFTEGIDGNQVPTSRVMYAMKVWFEQRIASLGAGRTYIDATEGGARIAGTEVMPLREAIDRYCREEFHPYQTILSVYESERARLRAGQIKARLRQVLLELDRELAVVEEVYRQALKVGRRAVLEAVAGTLTQQRYEETLRRFTALDRRLSSQRAYASFVRPFIDDKVQAINRALVPKLEEAVKLSARGEQLVKVYLSFFDAAKDTAARVRWHCQRLAAQLV